MQGALEAARHALTLDTTNAENRSLALRLRSQVERKNGGSCGNLNNSDGGAAAHSAHSAHSAHRMGVRDSELLLNKADLIATAWD